MYHYNVPLTAKMSLKTPDSCTSHCLTSTHDVKIAKNICGLVSHHLSSDAGLGLNQTLGLKCEVLAIVVFFFFFTVMCGHITS